MSAQTPPGSPTSAPDPPEEGGASPEVTPARGERSPRADSPAWRRVEAAGKVYFAACRQIAALINTLGSREGG